MQKAIKIIFGISFLFYIFVLGVILYVDGRGFAPDIPFTDYIRFSSNFIPFKTIGTYIKAILDESMNLDIPIKNLLGNLLLFFPMGVYLPFFIKKLNKKGIFVITMGVVLILVEMVQLITRSGSFDIDDLIFNMAGALIGFAIWKSKFIQKILA